MEGGRAIEPGVGFQRAGPRVHGARVTGFSVSQCRALSTPVMLPTPDAPLPAPLPSCSFPCPRRRTDPRRAPRSRTSCRGQDPSSARPGTRVRLHALLHVLLEKGLVILCMPVLQDLVDFRNQHVVDKARGGVEARVEVVRADDGFQAVRQYGLLGPAARVLLSLADEDEIVHAQAARDLREACLADDEALDARKLPFRLVGERRIEVLRHDEAEHRVPEELQALVVLPVLAQLVRVRTVRECVVEELQLSETDPGLLLEELELPLPLGFSATRLCRLFS